MTAVIAFFMLHMVQVVISFFWPRFQEANETRVADWLITNVRHPSFWALGAIVVSGVLLVVAQQGWLGAHWLWASVAILVALTAGKWLAAARKMSVNLLGTTGVVGLLILLWLMILKPF